jgi:hypothetical protein
MNKLVAALIAGAFSFGAFAQTAAPAADQTKPAASAQAGEKATSKKTTAKKKSAKKAKKAASAA